MPVLGNKYSQCVVERLGVFYFGESGYHLYFVGNDECLGQTAEKAELEFQEKNHVCSCNNFGYAVPHQEQTVEQLLVFLDKVFWHYCKFVHSVVEGFEDEFEAQHCVQVVLWVQRCWCLYRSLCGRLGS